MQTQEQTHAAVVQVGRVEAIFIAPAEGAPMAALDVARVVAGRGIEGDRYFDGRGHYSRVPPLTGRRLTLIAAEALEEMARETGIALRPDECRRNLCTRGVDLDALVGTRFRIGTIECYGERYCPPCGYIEELLDRPGLNRAMTDRGGIRAEILLDGKIRIGDTIAPSSIVP
jgi:MOSC domain-containing protein YiiM